MQGNTQEPTLRQCVHRDIEHLARLQGSIDNPANPTIAFLQNQNIAMPDERHRRRLAQAGDHFPYVKFGIAERLGCRDRNPTRNQAGNDAG